MLAVLRFMESIEDAAQTLSAAWRGLAAYGWDLNAKDPAALKEMEPAFDALLARLNAYKELVGAIRESPPVTFFQNRQDIPAKILTLTADDVTAVQETVIGIIGFILEIVPSGAVGREAIENALAKTGVSPTRAAALSRTKPAPGCGLGENQ